MQKKMQTIDEKIDELFITTPREVIEKERRRLIKLKNAGDPWWETPGRSNWARRAFGETLTEVPAEELFPWWYEPEVSCQICGQRLGIDEPMVSMKFSFCGEYGCGLNMHLRCPRLEELYDGYREKVGG